VLVIENIFISQEILKSYFTCDLAKCKGACCVEGDFGAPLEKHEINKILEIYPKVLPYLQEKAKKYVEQYGIIVKDIDGEYCTQTIKGAECVFAVYNPMGYTQCAFELAYQDGIIDFQKPLSCHLYPIRIKKNGSNFETLIYHKWSICKPGCVNGQSLKIPLYKFLKQALIRKYGEKWYNALEKKAKKYLL